MPASRIAILGAIAGLTIYLGLLAGRLARKLARTKAVLNTTAIGILILLLWDVISNAWKPADSALADHRYGHAVLHAG